MFWPSSDLIDKLTEEDIENLTDEEWKEYRERTRNPYYNASLTRDSIGVLGMTEEEFISRKRYYYWNVDISSASLGLCHSWYF